MTAAETIAQSVKTWNELGAPALMESFILKHGREFLPKKFPAREFPGAMRKKHNCFQNTFMLVSEFPGLRYVEGYIIPPFAPILMHHAWATDDALRLIDPTIRKPDNYAYYGIVFDRDQMIKWTLKQGHYGIIANDVVVCTDVIESMDPELLASSTRRQVACSPMTMTPSTSSPRS